MASSPSSQKFTRKNELLSKYLSLYLSFLKVSAIHKITFQINEKVVATIKESSRIFKLPVNWQHSAQAV